MDTDVRAQAQFDSPADRDKIAAIRAELPVTQRFAYLNAGTNGPLPRRAYEALVACARAELDEGRIGPSGFARLLQGLTSARDAMAALLGCDPAEVALTHNTTEGMNTAVMGLDWQRGDEVITAATEHPGGMYPAFLLHQRFGVKVRMTDIAMPERDPVDELRRALSPRTKAVILSHVSWATGMVLPLRALADLAHEAGALLICDAAQSCGMVPSDVYALGVDAYACSGQKWLCGPDGTGALFVRKDRWPDIQQTFIGYFGVQPGMSDMAGNFVPSDTARRFQVGALHPGSLDALVASLRWIGEELGWEWVYGRIAALGHYCYDTLAALDGVTMITPREQMAGLVHFRVEGIAPAELTARLNEKDIRIRDTHFPEANRVSTGFYNTEDEIDRLARAIQEIQRAGNAG